MTEPRRALKPFVIMLTVLLVLTISSAIGLTQVFFLNRVPPIADLADVVFILFTSVTSYIATLHYLRIILRKMEDLDAGTK